MRKDRHGITLLEVVAATVLLSGALLAAVSVQHSALRLQQAARRQLQTLADAAQRHDSLIATPCAQLVSGGARTPRSDYQWLVSRAGATSTLEFRALPYPGFGRPWISETAVPCP